MNDKKSKEPEDRPKEGDEARHGSFFEQAAMEAGRSFFERWSQATAQWTDNAMRLASGGSLPFPMAGLTSLGSDQLSMLSPERLEMMRDAGLYLRDLREVAGLTREELAEALDLGDKSLLESVETGTATLSFELILRLSALVARHDPLPFILRLSRSYNPELWRFMEGWGLTKLPLHYEREREFINIYRRHDAARHLSDDGFRKVLEFTRGAFEMALHFVAEQENIETEETLGEKGQSGSGKTEGD